MRSFQYQKQFCVLNRDSRVYNEIEDERVHSNLPFIKYLDKNFNEIVVDIKDFQP